MIVKAKFGVALFCAVLLCAAPSLAGPAVGGCPARASHHGLWLAQTMCCKVCTTGEACGNSCISKSKTCHKGKGCACDAGSPG